MKIKYEVSAGGIVFKKVGNSISWLIAQHSHHKGWVFPKGLIEDKEENEKMEEAAIREVKEEGGVKAIIINPDPMTTHYSYRFKEQIVKKTVHYFLMKYVSGDPKNHDWEMCDARFVKKDEVKTMLSYPSDKKAFEKALMIFLKNCK